MKNIEKIDIKNIKVPEGMPVLTKEQKKNGKLVVKICLAIALTIFFVNAFQVIIVSNRVKRKLQDVMQGTYLGYTQQSARVVRNLVDGYINGMNFYKTVCQGDDETIVGIFNQVGASGRPEYFEYISWTNAKGECWNDAGDSFDGTKSESYKVISNGANFFVSNPVNHPILNKDLIEISVAIREGNTLKGYITGYVNSDYISAVIEELDLGDLGYAVIYSSNKTMIGSTIENDADVLMEFSTINQNYPEDYDAISELWTLGHENQIEVHSSAGIMQHVISTPVEGTPWTVALFLYENELYSSVTVTQKAMTTGSILLLIVSVFVTIIIVVKSITPLKVVEKTIDGIASGDADLTRRIKLKANNEIGRVVDGFNKFSGKLQEIISTMKTSKDQLVSVGELLENSTQDTSSAINQIIAEINNMSGQVNAQESSVNQTATAVNQIASNIESLNGMIENQSSAVTEASAAIEQMIGNINSVNSAAQRMAVSFGELENKANSGVQKQEDVNTKIEEIERESQALQEANTVISGIAEQTNLLAMNAAIEAAHAGEAGKGFSVVADEIRKLSEDSSQQSLTIGNQLSKIIKAIEAIVVASKQASVAFTDVSNEINETAGLVNQISNAMQEQAAGSKEVSDALSNMNDISKEVQNSSYEMAEGNKTILGEIQQLKESSINIGKGMSEMGTGARKIEDAGEALIKLTDQMKDAIEMIGREVDQFKV